LVIEIKLGLWPKNHRKKTGFTHGKRLIRHRRTRRSDNISDLAWSRLVVEPAELSEVAVNREVFQAS